MASDGVPVRPPPPELSYTSGISRNVELLLGPWFVLFSALFIVLVSLHPLSALPGQPPPPPLVPIPICLFVVGLVFCYLAYFHFVCRLELSDGNLYWFGRFRRVKGGAPISDIVAIWTSRSFQWNLNLTIIELADGRTISVRNGKGLSAFVSTLVARSPGIDVADWKALSWRDRSESIGSFYVNGD